MANAARTDEENTSMIKEARASTDVLQEITEPWSKHWNNKLVEQERYFKKGELEVYLAQLKLIQEIMSKQSP